MRKRIAPAPIAAALLGGATPVWAMQDAAVAPAPVPAPAERVTFRSMDTPRTELVGYLFRPAGPAPQAGAPAVVLMHGRGGVYSSLAKGVYEASTLTRRLKFWADYWTERGYYALIVDSFGPRGYPTGFAAGTYATRPPDINEVTVRPLDAYGAMRFLRGLDGVADDRIGLMGFSNGASATLAAMADDKPGDMGHLGFRAGIALYPGCGLQNRFRQGYKTYAPVEVFVGTADEEVSPESCQRLVERAGGGRSGRTDRLRRRRPWLRRSKPQPSVRRGQRLGHRGCASAVGRLLRDAVGPTLI